MLATSPHAVARSVVIFADGAELHAELRVPSDAIGLVILGYPTGNSLNDARHQLVADVLNGAGCATLLCDLLTAEEELLASVTGDYRGDVGLLSSRLVAITDWCESQPELAALPIGYLGVGSAMPGALVAAAARPQTIRAIVVRGGSVDGIFPALRRVRAPTLVVVGEHDTRHRAELDEAMPAMSARKALLVVPRAGPLFAEPTTLEQFAEHAGRWFHGQFTHDEPDGDEPC